MEKRAAVQFQRVLPSRTNKMGSSETVRVPFLGLGIETGILLCRPSPLEEGRN